MSNQAQAKSSAQEFAVTSCNTWDEFIQAIRVKSTPDGEYIYRGHSNPDWLLSTEWERWYLKNREYLPKEDFPRRLAELLLEATDINSFKLCACGLPGLSTDGLSRQDWEILARHHGLRSRLLDWSQSPFVAAFFAFVDHLSENYLLGTKLRIGPAPRVAIWRLLITDGLQKEKGKFAYITNRKESFHRQRAQRGVFTRLSDDDIYDMATFLSSIGQSGLLTKYEIPQTEIVKAISDLLAMGISYATLFPDLDGAAKQVKLDWDLKMAMRIDEAEFKKSKGNSTPPSP